MSAGLGRRVCALSRARVLLFVLTCVLPFVAPRPAGAQRITGTVTRDVSGSPVAGAVVLLLQETGDSVFARGVTSGSGRFLLTAPVPGTYRIRVLRIGHRPIVQGPWPVGAMTTTDVSIVVSEMPVQLAQFDVRAESRCRNNPGPATLAGQLLTEARTAFLASVSALPDGEPRASYRLYTRPEDLRGEPAGEEQGSTVTRASARPFMSLSPDSLARVGYVVLEGDSVVYRAPDAEVLLSRHFLETHCFQVVEGVGGNTGAMGIAFKPIARRRGVVDIRGTIWMRPDSAVPRVVEFQYDPVSRDEEKAGIGGMVEFATTSAGTWFVRSYALRLPRLVLHRLNAVLGRRPVAGRVSQELVGIVVSGGDVLDMRVGRQTLFVDSAALRFAEAETEVQAARQAAIQAFGAGTAAPTSTAAAAAMARLTVRVRAANDSVARDAEVALFTRGTEVVRRTDAFGAARFETLPPDTVELQVRQVGFEAETYLLLLTSGENEVSLQMRATGTVLDRVHTVAERPVSAREAEIDRRIRDGVPNDFVRREYIDKVNPISLLQMIRRMRGVSIGTTVEGTYVPISSRGSRPSLLDPLRECVLRVMLDNVLLPEKYDLEAIPPMEVYAVELFAPGRIPPQFAGMRNDLWCGLIAVWTRSH